jgi:hypothetical protein
MRANLEDLRMQVKPVHTAINPRAGQVALGTTAKDVTGNEFE